MSKEYNSALQAQVEQFLKDKGISQAKAAPMMGISQTALSQYRRSMYDNGDIAALESKLEEFFRTQLEQQASTEKAMPYRPIQDYIPTSISEDVCKLIRYCQIEKGMVSWIGISTPIPTRPLFLMRYLEVPSRRNCIVRISRKKDLLYNCSFDSNKLDSACRGTIVAGEYLCQVRIFL